MMRTLVITILLLGWMVSFGWANSAYDTDVVYYWAPVIFQRGIITSNILEQDNVFTKVNYDNDWRTNNNSFNLSYYFATLAVYYSAVITDTHYYLGYYFYYPRHGGDTPHDHDMIGVMLAVRKADGGSGIIEAMVTYSNKHWRYWEGSHLRLVNGRPALTVSAGTHELTAANSAQRLSASDGVFPTIPETVLRPLISGQAGRTSLHDGYQLADLNELWQRRNDIGRGHTFGLWGHFDSYYYHAADAPWVWEYRHENWLANPAQLMQLSGGVPAKPVTYTINQYL